MTRIKEYDGLRAFAFLGVFFWHATPPYGFAWGVDVFLVLSAYLLGSRLVREREATSAVDVARFYERRIRRIWPLYFLVLAIAVLLVRDSRDAAFRLPTALFFANFAAAHLRYWPSLWIGPMWSTSLEEQFYAVVPWLCRSRRTLRTAAWAMLACGILGRGLTWFGVLHWMWCVTVFRFDAIAIGLLLATEPRLPRLSSWRGWLMLCAGAAVMFAGTRYLPLQLAVLAASVGAGMILVGARGNPVLAHPAIAWLGERSYGLYLLHGGMLELLPWPVALGAATALAGLSYRFVEQPVMRAQSRSPFPAAASAGPAATP